MTATPYLSSHGSHRAELVQCLYSKGMFSMSAGGEETKADRVAAKKLYDIQRRPMYAEKKADLRKGWKDTERAAYKNRINDPLVWASYALSRVRFRAKKYDIVCTITAADLVLPDKCPVLGIPLSIGFGKNFRTHPNCPSVDRFDNKLGYVPGNVRVISVRANVLKNDATLDEMRAIVRYMEGGVS